MSRPNAKKALDKIADQLREIILSAPSAQPYDEYDWFAENEAKNAVKEALDKVKWLYR